MPKRANKSVPFLISPIDPSGRKIHAEVLSVAHEIGPRVVRHAEKLLGDPALTLSLFEEVAGTVSIILLKNPDPPIQNLRGYLFLAFMRRVRKEKRKQAVFDETGGENWKVEQALSGDSKIEQTVLVNEIFADCDSTTREIARFRLEGHSWQEIAEKFDISRDAAKSRFYKIVRHFRTGIQARNKGA
jgi:DNA-directed RNA polymerase specialized sigma24 family protein